MVINNVFPIAMTTSSEPGPSTPQDAAGLNADGSAADKDLIVDFREVFSRLRNGLPITLGLGMLSIVIAAIAFFAATPILDLATTARITFSFSGLERGQYPDKSNFQPEDILAPDIVAEAIRQQGLGESDILKSKVRAALSVEGIIPSNVIKERDRLRAAGQTPPTFVPDEYVLTLVLPATGTLTRQQREALLNSIVTLYREKFQRTYANLPLQFGSAFQNIADADYYDYELLFNQEIESMRGYLSERLSEARAFRSKATNSSFLDLLEQLDSFSQIQLPEVLGIIHAYTLCKDRQKELQKLSYYLRESQMKEKAALEEEKVVKTLLNETEARAQNYVLGLKAQSTQGHSETPIIDQGLIDSLLANDSYNFLIRRALDAGLRAKAIASQNEQIQERLDRLSSLEKPDPSEQSRATETLERSLAVLKVSYSRLVANIRQTNDDYKIQQFANAIRISQQPHTESILSKFAAVTTLGFIVGMSLGLALSLLGFTIAPRPNG